MMVQPRAEANSLHRFTLRVARWAARKVVKAQRTLATLFYRAGGYRWTGQSFKGLHLGGGNNRIETFLNIDCDRNSQADVFSDLEKIRLQDASASAIYASHVFEHFPAVRALGVLKEWARVLKPGAPIYLCVPDAEALFRRYLHELDANSPDRDALLHDLLHCLMGGQLSPYDFHYNLFSYATLSRLLLEAGFTDPVRFNRDSLPFAPFWDFAQFNYKGTAVSLNVVAFRAA